MPKPVGGTAGHARPEVPSPPELTLDERTALRRCVLAVSVLHDIDVLPIDTGIVLAGVPQVTVTLAELAQAIRAADPNTAVARERLHRWLRVRRAVAGRSFDELAESAR